MSTPTETVARPVKITVHNQPPLPRWPIWIGRCRCREWPMAAGHRGRCGRCGTAPEFARTER